jgi:hypothetical protein
LSDERLRNLERAVASSPSDTALKKALRRERERLGLRPPGPRRKVRAGERPRELWCPVCRTWSLRRASQKERGLRERRISTGRATGQSLGGVSSGPVIPPGVYARVPRRLVRLEGERRARPTRFCTGELQTIQPARRTDYQVPQERVTYDNSDGAILNEALALANVQTRQGNYVGAHVTLARRSVLDAADRLGRRDELEAARGSLFETEPERQAQQLDRLRTEGRVQLEDGTWLRPSLAGPPGFPILPAEDPPFRWVTARVPEGGPVHYQVPSADALRGEPEVREGVGVSVGPGLLPEGLLREHAQAIVHSGRCPGPTRGQSCRVPLDVLEARLAELFGLRGQGFFGSYDEESWFRHRITRERARLVRLGLCEPDPPAPHVCRQRDFDYVPGNRNRIRCSVCGVERRAD